jgi:hypothetical protein
VTSPNRKIESWQATVMSKKYYVLLRFLYHHPHFFFSFLA